MTKEGSSEPQRPSRAILVGAGLMGRYHARAAAAAGAAIVAIVDRDAQAASSLASQFRSARPFADFRKSVRASEADVVHICTPAGTHVELAQLAADARLHALIEKPLAATAEDTRLVLDNFASAGRFACPTHQYAFQRSVCSAIESFPRLGPVRHIAFDICSAGADRGGMDLDELVGEILPHPLAMIQTLLPTSDVGALEWSCFRTGPGEWQMFAQSGDVALTIAMSMSGRPTRFRTTVTADRGTVELDNFHDYAVLLPGNVSRAQKMAAPFIRDGLGLFAAGRNLVLRAIRSELAYPGLTNLVDVFYRAVREPRTVAPPITAEQAIAVATARDRLIELSGSG
ncbi:Gfo/Idh/MocA family protein [Sphingomonas sediminicola]|nr:Gfo/Idh/MocA family oxidoreductase [Sphingomonas sediminicola]